MAVTKTKRAQNPLEIILGADSVAACCAAFRSALSPFGIDCFSAGEFDAARRNRAIFAALDWPESWQRFYFGSSLIERDPLVENIGRYGRPFTWSDLRADRLLAQLGTEGLEAAAEAGWRDGLAVPLPRGGSRYGIVSLVARDIIPDEHRHEMTSLSLAFHQAIMPLARRDGFAQPPCGLSPREIEALKLVVAGRSDRQIAEALGIAVTTAHEHVERAKRRLTAKTRAELAAVAVSLGIVTA